MRSLWLTLALVGCAPQSPLRPTASLVAPPFATHSGSSAGSSSVADATAPDAALEPLPRLANAPLCPVHFEGADVPLAIVDGVMLTGCDLVIDALLSVREGYAAVTPRLALARLIESTLLSRRTLAAGLERDPSTARRLRQTLSDAVVRDDARRAVTDASSAQREEYVRAHADRFRTAERVHVRAIEMNDAARARATAQEARAGADFAQLVRERSTSPDAARDEGDLGLATREGSDRVARAVAEAAFSLADGEVAAEPVAVERTVLVGRRRRPRTERRYLVVQRLSLVAAEELSAAEAQRRAASMLTRDRFVQALSDARRALLERLTREHGTLQIDAAALRQVRIHLPPRSPARPTRSVARGRRR